MLGLIGDEWSLLLVQQALQGVRRYAEFKARLPISHSVLSARLSRLTEAGILARHAYQDNPTRLEYRLTPRGGALWPVLLCIWDWELRWVPAQAATLPGMRHDACGGQFRPVLSCRTCRQPVGARDVTAAFGPSGSWPRSVPDASTRRRAKAGVAEQPGRFPETMSLIGNRWSSALLGAAFWGATRFGEFERRLGAPPTVVADRLRTFCELDVLEATARGGTHYRLTDKGRAFFPVLATALRWALEWFSSPEGSPVLLRHRACAAEFVPRLGCDHCGDALRGADIVVVPHERSLP